MHMADALLSPAVGITMWGVAAGAVAYSSMKLKQESDDRKAPLMGVLGAFVFAAQMINFTIPATGSSGHLGGGLLLAILLGPHASFLTIASILTVQSLFFADGGILALGCNIFNLGFFPAFIAYPLIFRKIVNSQPSRLCLTTGSVIAAVVGLQMGAFSVVLETVASGISSLPFSTFVTLMQPIHLAIGVVEGLVTAAVVSFVSVARPEMIRITEGSVYPHGIKPLRGILLSFLGAALLTGGIVSWFASEKPDGLEWAIAGVTGAEEVSSRKGGVHDALANLQEKIAILPDYAFKADAVESHAAEAVTGEKRSEAIGRIGTSVAGGIGAFICLLLAFSLGFILRKRGHAS